MVKQRSIEAEKWRSGGAEKRRSGEGEKRRSRETENREAKRGDVHCVVVTTSKMRIMVIFFNQQSTDHFMLEEDIGLLYCNLGQFIKKIN